MSNSKLVNYTKLSPMRSSPRNHRIDTITIHHMAGNLSAETCGNVFQTRQASSNYGVDSNGRVGLYVDEGDRSWASANPANDHRAVTIEVANCGGAPDWPVSGAAYDKLIELTADICRRNGITRLVWSGDKSDRVNHRSGCNMTVHQDFMATSCPGPYLLARMPQIAADVNAKLGAPPSAPAGGPSAPAGGPSAPAGGPSAPAGGPSTPATGPSTLAGGPPAPASGPRAGDVVDFTGTRHYVSSDANRASACRPGRAKVTKLAPGARHPYHLIGVTGAGSTVYGWVDAGDVG